jgi:hypothetical protein
MDFNKYFQYNSETGVIIWINKPSSKIKIGDIAGNVKNNGYLQVMLKRKCYYVHRIAWYLHYKEWPKNDIDHINGIKIDNRINNLRDVSASANAYNQKRHRDKLVKYYYFCKEKQKWRVRASINGKQKTLASFKTEELARQFVETNIHSINNQTKGEKHV